MAWPMILPLRLQGPIMRTAVAVLAVVLGCTAAMAQDLSTNFKVSYQALGVHAGRPASPSHFAGQIAIAIQ